MWTKANVLIKILVKRLSILTNTSPINLRKTDKKNYPKSVKKNDFIANQYVYITSSF